MFFKPTWYKKIPEQYRPKESLIEELEELRNKYSIPHEQFLIFISKTPWAIKKMLIPIYQVTKMKAPQLSEKELWKSLIISRIGIGETVKIFQSADNEDYPKHKREMDEIFQNLDKTVEQFENFDDVVYYFASIEEKEDKLNDLVIMIISELDHVLYWGDR